jgi:hypothetical protein
VSSGVARSPVRRRDEGLFRTVGDPGGVCTAAGSLIDPLISPSGRLSSDIVPTAVARNKDEQDELVAAGDTVTGDFAVGQQLSSA